MSTSWMRYLLIWGLIAFTLGPIVGRYLRNKRKDQST